LPRPDVGSLKRSFTAEQKALTQEKYRCRVKYGVGDVVIWDNASLLHSATLIDPNDPRTLWRITIKEERKPS